MLHFIPILPGILEPSRFVRNLSPPIKKKILILQTDCQIHYLLKLQGIHWICCIHWINIMINSMFNTLCPKQLHNFFQECCGVLYASLKLLVQTCTTAKKCTYIFQNIESNHATEMNLSLLQNMQIYHPSGK